MYIHYTKSGRFVKHDRAAFVLPGKENTWSF
nr:MAG TPA: hypothetical protein [Caudoviricetes sp.]DAW30344.1 MAG TPA: hypothetical protein [Caudoviricetes sp.]DAW39010.1 MAG TPA: hypothetical protein [Caudoviricetes sp.]